jgi:hypothetical protein
MIQLEVRHNMAHLSVEVDGKFKVSLGQPL